MTAPGDLAKPELLFELARGGMGAVHLARVAGIGGFERYVVVKRILDATDPEAEALERFLSEARIAARIHHANVVGTHHVGTDEAGLYMVLDYVEGGSLAALTDRVALRGDHMPIPIVLRIALDALAGLGAVHRTTGGDGAPLGIVHRDVSLQNILVGRDGVARLADFGIAKSTRTAVKTKTGSLIGKLLYLPPEHIRHEPTDHTIDIYMLGVTLWCALTGEEPWQGTSAAQVMHSILTEALPAVASRRNEPVAPEIETLIRTAAHPVASQRYQSAEQMAQTIEALGRERGWVASQHEVATFVEGLLGVDLDRRRERIAQLAMQPPLAATRIAVEGSPAAAAKVSFPKWIWALVALLLTGIAIYLLPTEQPTHPDNPSNHSERQPSPPTPLAVPAAPTAAAAASATLPSPPPPVTPGPASSAPSTPAMGNPTVAQSATAVAPHTAPKTVPATTSKAARPPSAPDDISPRNPYR